MRNQEHRLLASVLIDNIGNGLHSLIVGKILYDATGSIWAFGLSIVCEYILSIILGFVAGPMVDRGSPKQIAAAVDYIRGSLLILAALSGGSLMLWLAILVINAGKPFARSAAFALIPTVVQPTRLTQYYSTSSAVFQIGQLLGVAIAGPVLAFWGTKLALLIDGVTYIIAASLVSTLRGHLINSNARGETFTTGSTLHFWFKTIFTNIRQDWLDLLSIIRKDRALALNLFLAGGDFLAITFFNLMLAPIVNHHFGNNPTWLTIFDGTFALSAIASAFLTRFLQRSDGTATIALGLQGIALAIIATSGSAWVIIPAVTVFALANVQSLSLFMSSLQLRAQDKNLMSMAGRIAGMRHLVLAIMVAILVPIGSGLYQWTLNGALLFGPAIVVLFSLASHFGRTILNGDKIILVSSPSAKDDQHES